MEGLLMAHEHLEKKGNLAKAVADAQRLIDLLQAARDATVDDQQSTAAHTAKLKTNVRLTLDKLDDGLKDVNKGLNHYQKALKDKFKAVTLPSAASEPLTNQPSLIDRAIAMHLLREGQFDVARTFVREVHDDPRQLDRTTANTFDAGRTWVDEFSGADAMDEGHGGSQSQGQLQEQFSEMYNILDALRNKHDLSPAIQWACHNSRELEGRGSNLEFELARLKFVELYTADAADAGIHFEGPLRALAYARSSFTGFNSRYSDETSSLLGSLAFSPDLGNSPYKALFFDKASWDDVSMSFIREFCGMLGLSERSPLYTAITAGSIAIPVLEKVERIMQQTRGQWTSVNELPVETPLPPGYLFHSIFVCPVSKEQATDANPPMMLPCGHVIAKESLEMHSKGKPRMKCPYCPSESHPREAQRVFI